MVDTNEDVKRTFFIYENKGYVTSEIIMDANGILEGVQIECTTDKPEESSCILVATSSTR